MAAAPDCRRVFDARTQRIISYWLILALLAPACAVSGSRSNSAPALSTADREACEELARKTEALIQGHSVWPSAAVVGAAGSLLGAAVIAGAGFSSDRPETVGVALGVAATVGVIGGLLGATLVVAKNAGVRKASYDEAMEVCLRPALLTRTLGPEHPEVARNLHALAYRYHRLAEFAKAEPLYARALATQETSLGANAPEMATILDDYAALLRQIGRVVEATELEQRARAIRSR